MNCCSSVSKRSPTLKNWLKARCEPLPFDDSVSHVPIPKWHTMQICNMVPHFSHNLFSVKGSTFCLACGAFSARKVRLLSKPCEKKCSVSFRRALDGLTSGQLPVVSMSWPRLPRLRQMALECPISSTFDDPDDVWPFDAEAHENETWPSFPGGL